MTDENYVPELDPTAVPLPEQPAMEVSGEVSEPPKEQPNNVEDLSDLTRVDKEDIMGKHDGNSDPDDLSDLTDLSDEDMDDILEVDNEDVMGEAPKPPPRRYRVSRPRRPPQPPISTLGGIQY